MTYLGNVANVPSSSGQNGAGLSFTTGELSGRVRSLSSSTPPGRLTSLRTRDLTLGGALKKTKEEVYVAPRKERRERDERRRENRGRRREKPQTIQCHSIFEQGPADNVHKPGWHGATDLLDTATSPVCKLVKKEGKRSEKDEDEILQRDDFIGDPALSSDADLKPIQLPLSQSSSFTKSQILMSMTTFERVPENRAGDSRTELPKPEQLSLVEVLQDLSLSDREELFFLQLPDCMPKRTSGHKVNPAFSTADKHKMEGKPEEKRPPQAQEAVANESCPVLSQFPEGFLGKLQIRKSGKVKLKLGDIVMDVSEGAAFSFLQQLVSVHLSDGRTGDMMVLGNIHHKLVLSPEFQALLKQVGTEQQQGPL